jgi:hypothetical protein
MKLIRVEEVSVYEAFQRYGLCEGDSPFARIVLDEVANVLYELGYEPSQIFSARNDAIATLVKDGQVIDLSSVAERQGIDMESSPGAVRQVLLAAGLHHVVAALEELDREESCEAVGDDGYHHFPSCVLVRGQEGITDIQLFASPRTAARTALALRATGANVELVVPLDSKQATASRRYRQVLHDEELERLAR